MGELLATLFVVPLEMPAWLRLWMFLPLAACIAAVYRATRARDLRGIGWATVVTFVNIVVGMIAIAVGAYLIQEVVLRFS